MPRKPKKERKAVTVVVEGKPIKVTLHPPAGARKSWFAYWAGLVASKSTGQKDFAEAVRVAEAMLRGNGHRPVLEDPLLTDEELEQIQRFHFDKKTDRVARRRAEKTLQAYLQAAE